MTILTLSPLLERIRPILQRSGVPVFLVGGAVRDALLGRASHDLDFAVPERGIELAFQVADALRWPAYILDQERDVGRVMVGEVDQSAGGRTMLDFARFRGPDLRADLHGRDFTINALAIQVSDTRLKEVSDPYAIIDYFGGVDDLAARRLHRVHDASLREDPVRALRAVRLAHGLDFTLSTETEAALSAAAPLLSHSSPERIRDELLKMIRLDAPHTAVRALSASGLLPVVLPELADLKGVFQSPPHREDVLDHTLTVLRWLARVEAALWSAGEDEQHFQGDHYLRNIPFRQQLQAHFTRPVDGGLDGRMVWRLGTLFHDCGKKATQSLDADGRIRFFGHEAAGAKLAVKRLNRLALSNEAVDQVRLIVQNHMRPLLLAGTPSLPSRRAVYRYFRAAQTAGLDAALLSLADHLGKYDGPGPAAEWQHLVDVVAELLNSYFTAYEEVVAPVRLVDGTVLMEQLNLPPGREIGRLLALIQEAQAAGEITDAAAALDLARKQVRMG